MVLFLLKIKEAVVVEGIHDKIVLSRFVDTLIVTVNGFSVYGNKKQINLLQLLAVKQGIIILTDSDWAGRRIRNYIKSCVTKGVVKHAYIPQILGKERRKSKASAEGFLGVEGMCQNLLRDILGKIGIQITYVDEGSQEYKEKNTAYPVHKIQKQQIITKAHFYEDGFTGKSDSAERRRQLCRFLGLPSNLSSNALLQLFNSEAYSIDEYNEAVRAINKNIKVNKDET